MIFPGVFNSSSIASGGSSGNGMDPITMMALASLGGGVFNGILGASQSSKQNALTKEQIALQQALGAANLGAGSAGLAPSMERQKMALTHAMLGGARPPSITPPSHIAPHMGTVNAAFQIPKEGFDPSTIAFSGPEAMRAQEAKFNANLQGINPKYITGNLDDLGYGAQGPPAPTPPERPGRNRPRRNPEL